MNAKTGSCSEASSSEEEDIGIHKGRRKSDFDNTNEELMESVVKRKRLHHLSVVEKVTLKL